MVCAPTKPLLVKAALPAPPVRIRPKFLLTLLAVILNALGLTTLLAVATFLVVAPVLVHTTLPLYVPALVVAANLTYTVMAPKVPAAPTFTAVA